MKKKGNKNPLNTISIVYFPLVRLFTQVFSRMSTIHPGIFRGRALSSDSVSPRTNTIASRDQFKPMRIRENSVVNYRLGFLISSPYNLIYTEEETFKEIMRGGKNK